MVKPLALLVCLLAASAARGQPLLPAELRASWWLDGSDGLDISGLAFCAGKLLAVSDKDSRTIYMVDFTGPGSGPESAAALRPHLPLGKLPPPSGDWKAALLDILPGATADFEGISCDGDAIYLVSERYHRLARLAPGQAGSWLPARWAVPARKRGYLQHFNAAAEGLVRAGGETWIALERQERGLVHLSAGGTEFHDLPPVAGLDFRGRPPDVTGLDLYQGGLYTLERNAHAVCRRSPGDLRAEWCIDYRAVEEGPAHVYRETRYGKGEGLAVNEEGIFVVLDNNNVARAASPDDRRGLLLQLAHPQDPRPAEQGPRP